MNSLTIPFFGLKRQYNSIRTETLEVTDQILRSGDLINGNYTSEFENWLAKKNKSKYAVCVHSGTSALEAIAEYYQTTKITHKQSTVLIPSLTYYATANAFMRAGWDVHFVDTDHQGIFDIKKIPDIDYQAVILVGLYGASIHHMGDITAWKHWLLHDKIIIEDAAQHWLAADCTRIGRATAISFDPTKNLSCNGNGGAVITNDSDIFNFVRAWRDNGKPINNQTGTNSKMSEIDCAQMLVKSRYIDQWQKRRKDIVGYWISRLKHSNIDCLITQDSLKEHACHKFVITSDNRDMLQKNLLVRKIETKIHYQQPLHEVGIYRQYPGPDILSCASALSRRVLSLPIYPELTDLEVEYIIDQTIDCA